MDDRHDPSQDLFEHCDLQTFAAHMAEVKAEWQRVRTEGRPYEERHAWLYAVDDETDPVPPAPKQSTFVSVEEVIQEGARILRRNLELIERMRS